MHKRGKKPKGYVQLLRIVVDAELGKVCEAAYKWREFWGRGRWLLDYRLGRHGPVGLFQGPQQFAKVVVAVLSYGIDPLLAGVREPLKDEAMLQDRSGDGCSLMGKTALPEKNDRLCAPGHADPPGSYCREDSPAGDPS
ncbi:hypothetical protein Cci01nite_71960 [Catellatospora citrea]|uniref:Uncharacterized protein n=1 Tax=Catellatospora citrea TaxID=53366 RepID=A0A8J3P307_9ACTN|nr:hypothetical protein Cci01nite_71960 [Catellatospora citrea]